MATQSKSMLDHALAYAKLGLPVLPLHSILKDGTCSCGVAKCHSPGKHPRTHNGLKDATTREGQIKKWWGPTRWPNANIGGIGGSYLCLDIDAKSDGFSSLERLIEAHAPLPDTAVVATGEFDNVRGRHYWFHVPEDHEKPGTRAGVRAGIDIRCAGGYAVLPPSQHASGVSYEWEIGSIDEVVNAPDWVLSLVPEFVEGDRVWTPNPHFQMSKQVKQFLKGELEVEIGEQREFLVAAARSVLSTGRDVDTSSTLLWEGYNGEGGISNCPWEDDDPWTPEGIYALVSDIFSKPPTSPLEKDFTSDDFSLDDMGNGKRLVASFKDGYLVYVPELERWHEWDEKNKCFKATSDSWLRMRWGGIVDELIRQARQALDEATSKALSTHARNSRMKPRVDAAVYFARDYVHKPERELNADKYLFAVKNGVVDLRTGKLLENQPSLLITRQSPINYNPKAKSKLFDNFLRESVPNDDLREYLQLICGYTLTGSTAEDAFFYLYGRPATGKTTFSEALHHVMGSYALTADTSSFMRDSKRTGSGPSEDLARLVGSRLVTMGEVEQNERLASALVSRITGGDAITARVLYGKTFEYHPQFKLWIAANELPRIASTRSGIWRRVKIISFDQQVPLKKRDPLLRHKIKEPESAEAILAWMVEGAVKWRENYDRGKVLVEPVEVSERVAEYQRESDHVSVFAEEALEHADDQDKVPVNMMYAHYKRWCDIEGRERREQQKALARKLKGLGYTAKAARYEDHIQRCWVGVKLLELEGSSGKVTIKGATTRKES